MTKEEAAAAFREHLAGYGKQDDASEWRQFEDYWENSKDSGAYQGAGYDQSWDQIFAEAKARDAIRFTRPTASNGGVGGDLDPEGMGAQGGGDWWSMNAPGGIGGSFGAAPEPFGETFTAPQRPGGLQNPYQPAQWNETFQPVSADSLKSDPGYLARLDATQRGFERSAAARGSVLSGGFVGRTLPRALGEQASNEFGAANNRAFDQYMARYGAFTGNRDATTQARGINEAAYQGDVSNASTQFNTRYRTYLDSINNRRNAENDLWTRNQDLVGNSLTAAGLRRPS